MDSALEFFKCQRVVLFVFFSFLSLHLICCWREVACRVMSCGGGGGGFSLVLHNYYSSNLPFLEPWIIRVHKGFQE